MSASIEQSVEYLRSFGRDYGPGQAVQEALQDKTMVMVIGASAVGKDTSMRNAALFDPYFGKVRSFTTRDRGPDDEDGDYDYVGEDAEALGRIATAALAGRLVQLSPHPTLPYVYGSELNAYNNDYMMLDPVAAAVDSIRRLPFKSHVEIGLVCEPAIWWRRFQDKGFDKEQARKRMLEGVTSLQWSMEREGLAWVDNSDQRSKTARQIVGIARGEMEPDSRARKVGIRLQKEMVRRLG